MPTYVTLDTIQEVMNERKCIVWRVFDEDENQLHYYSPPPTTIWRDSYNTLEKFLSGITGTNFVMIRVYAPEYKQGKGGDVATTIFTYYYRLKASNGKSDSVSSAPAMDGGYMALLKEINDMRLEHMKEKHEAEMERLKEKIKENKDEDKNYFEKVAKVIGREMGKEWLKSEGYSVDDEGIPIGKTETPEKKKTNGTTTTTTTAPAEKTDEVKKVFQRTGDATVRIMKVSKQLGSDYNAVAESFEDIAELAEKNPLKLKQIFDALKEK